MVTAKSIIGWNFKNTYVNFPDTILTRISPVAVKDPSIAIFNEELSKELGLGFTSTKGLDGQTSDSGIR